MDRLNDAIKSDRDDLHFRTGRLLSFIAGAVAILQFVVVENDLFQHNRDRHTGFVLWAAGWYWMFVPSLAWAILIRQNQHRSGWGRFVHMFKAHQTIVVFPLLLLAVLLYAASELGTLSQVGTLWFLLLFLDLASLIVMCYYSVAFWVMLLPRMLAVTFFLRGATPILDTQVLWSERVLTVAPLLALAFMANFFFWHADLVMRRLRPAAALLDLRKRYLAGEIAPTDVEAEFVNQLRLRHVDENPSEQEAAATAVTSAR